MVAVFSGGVGLGATGQMWVLGGCYYSLDRRDVWLRQSLLALVLQCGQVLRPQVCPPVRRSDRTCGVGHALERRES
jgi:hypothetical protein